MENEEGGRLPLRPFPSENIWKNQIACLFVLAVVRNHLSSSSFCVFRIGGVLVFVKDQGLPRVFGFPLLWVFLGFLSPSFLSFPIRRVIVLVFCQ